MNKKRASIRLLRGEERIKFLTKGNEYCLDGFESTRKELLKICESDSTPQARWEKCRPLLINNLESQFPVFYSVLGSVKINKKSWMRKPFKFEIDLWRKLLSIIYRGEKSYMFECIKIVSAYNAYDRPNLIPKDVRFVPTCENEYESYYLRHDGVRLEIYLKNFEKISIDMSKNSYISLLSTLSMLRYNDGEKDDLALINHDEFFHKYQELYPDFVKPYKLTSQSSPEFILNSLNKDLQREFLEYFLTKRVEKWSWSKISMDTINNRLLYDKVLKPKNIKLDDIYDRRPYENPIWESDMPYLNPFVMSYELAGDYLKSLSEPDIKLCLSEASLNIGFELFNIPYVREVTENWQNNDRQNELRTMSGFLHERFMGKSAKTTETERKYWRIYLDVNRLVEFGMKKKEAYSRLERKYNMNKSTLSTRYKEKAIEVKSKKLDVRTILNKYGLHEFEFALPSNYENYLRDRLITGL